MKEISLHILDLVQNSITAGAKCIDITVTEDISQDRLTVIISDDGCGMEAERAKLVQDPFVTSRTTRKVGLGIPLFKAGCIHCEGEFNLHSMPGAGTTISGCYRMSHIDRPPLGDIADTIYMITGSNPHMDILFTHRIDDREFVFNTKEIRLALDGVPLDEPEVQQWIREFLIEGEKDLHGGVSL
jgi:hypothetical protein